MNQRNAAALSGKIKVTLPDYLKKFKKEALHINKQHLVKDIEFSGATYQVLVEDPLSHLEFWVFMQLDGKGHIKDAFCSCEEIPDQSGCIHLAAAYIGLFKHFTHPLHYRFARSLWNQLCRLYEERLGDDPRILLKKEAGEFTCHSRLGKTIFSLKGKTEEVIRLLEKILHKEKKKQRRHLLNFQIYRQKRLFHGRRENQILNCALIYLSGAIWQNG